jgi:hypothetical protein
MELHLNSVGFEFWPEAIGVALPRPPPLGRLWTLCPAKSEPWPSHFTHNLYRINVARMVHVGISINPTIGGVSRGSARVCCRDCEHPVSANSISGDSNTADVLPLTLPATAQDLQLVGGFNPCQQCRSQLESSSRVGRMEFMYTVFVYLFMDNCQPCIKNWTKSAKACRKSKNCCGLLYEAKWGRPSLAAAMYCCSNLE